jgi:hypothetical protein
MTHASLRRPSLMLVLTAFALAAPGCKDTKETTNPDEVTTKTPEPEPEPEPEPTALPPQDPDPAELATLYDRYLKGDYAAVASEAGALRDSLTADTQVRAHAMASAIMALAAAEELPEDGKDAAEQAVADSDRLDDPEVQQLAHIAHGVYLVRVQDPTAGQAELVEAVNFAGPFGALAQLMLAEAHLNQAFGVGDEDMKIKNPGKLDEARTAYQAALDAAQDAGSQLLMAHAHEGLAAVAKYKGEKQEVCDHAQQAEDIYVAAGATDYVREVPSLLASEGKCKSFKKAK